jgi:Secretion system C-terminal sorting domain/PKD domain
MANKFTSLLLLALFIGLSVEFKAQTVFWLEDFDDGGGGRWTLENAPGSGTNPTPGGIVGLTYEVNNPIFDNFIINDRNTPQLSGNIVIGTEISNQGTFVNGRHYACSAPSNLPNPFINTGGGPNQSLHITAHSACATLLYGGTAQSDDWNCISDPDNGDVQTKTEQIAFLNQNIDATGKCNIKITADFFLGGDADGIKSHSTILYSIDAGVTWKIVQDSLRSCTPFLAGSCNNWHRRSFEIPSDADNQPDLRIAFRWYDDGDINNTGDYALGASFNVDNVMLSSCDIPNADFSANIISVCKNQTVTLTSVITSTTGLYTNCFSTITDNCPVTAYSWNITKSGGGPPVTITYVNGTSSTDANPQVQFNGNATFNVELTATNCAGDSVVTYSNLITVADCAPTANFSADMLTACIEPTAKLDTVTFSDLSTTPTTPITAWNWVFTPGTVTFVNGTSSTSQNPQVTFNSTGTYQVSLQVTTSEGTDTEIKSAYIEAISCECAAGGIGFTNIWFEDFEAVPCNSGCDPSIVSWTTTNTGINSGSANSWYVSCAENGQAAGACGAGCGNDESLHVGSTTLGDIGAAYDAGQTTNKRIESPTIDCSGASTMTVSFNYIMNGELNIDFASLLYFNGTVWTTITSPLPMTPTGACGAQGQWTNYSVALPAGANNNPNVKIGFNWTNDAASGSDPSFAVDDISIDGTGPTGGPSTTWNGTISNNWNTAANWSAGSVPINTDDILIPSLTNLVGTFMPTISAPAVAQNVCNFGTLTLTGDNTLTIDVDLLNEGVVTTTTTVNTGDVIFSNSASIYRGAGTMYDVDVSVTSSNLTLETDLIARSLNIATTGTVDLATLELSINKNLTKSAGTFIPTNGVINFVDACGSCVDATSNALVTLNVNQAFGNVFVNKTAGVVTGLISNVNHTFTSPKTLTIQSGILDVNTNTLIGTGNITMTGGELQLAKCATVIPELTGAYSLTAGQVTFDGACNQVTKVSSPIVTYYDVEYTGTGIKTLDNNNLLINNQFLLNLPTTTGNYVNTATDSIKILNNSNGVVTRTGGHVVGYLSRAITSNGGAYNFYVGSDNSDGETYYEPMVVTPQNISGATAIVANFNDASPNPGTVVPYITFGFSPTMDTIQDVEDEGYWTLNTNSPIIGGTYEATVSPDVNFWTFSKIWGGGQYTLLKQPSVGNPWNYTIGGSRVDDSTTTNFSNFSNFALGFSNNNPLPLPVKLIAFKGHCNDGKTLLSWATASEINSEKFILEKSENGINFSSIGEITAAGYSNKTEQYTFEYYSKSQNSYYRLLQMDYDGTINYLNTIFVSCKNNDLGFDFEIYPNPTTGILNVNIFDTQKGIVDITIYNLTGSIIDQSSPTYTSKGLNVLSQNLNHIPNGIYIINARSKNGESKNLRLVISH